MKNEGSTLIEVIVVTILIATVITAITSATVKTLASSTYTKMKSQATKYAQEGIELVRFKRDASWYGFLSMKNSTWCVDDSGTWRQTQICPLSADSLFSRTIELQLDETIPLEPKMVVISKVTWKIGGKDFSSVVSTRLTQWK